MKNDKICELPQEGARDPDEGATQQIVNSRQSLLMEIYPMVTLAVPVVVGLASSTALSNVDSFVLGKIDQTALAVASVAHSALVIFYAALYGFTGVVGLFVGRAHGARHACQAQVVLRNGLLLGGLAGCAGCLLMLACLPLLAYADFPQEVLQNISGFWIFMSLSLIPYSLAMAVKHYLDATDQAWLGAALISVPLLLHIPFSAVLVFGIGPIMGIGLIGSAVATMLSFWIGFALMLYVVRSLLSDNAKNDYASLRLMNREGLSISFQYFCESSAVAFGGLMIGFLGTGALAANQIAFSTAVLIYMLPLGISGAVTVRISQAVGQGEKFRVQSIGAAGLVVVTSWMALFSLILLYFDRPIARLFTSDEAIVVLAGSLFAAIAFMQVFDGVQSVSLGALRGMMDNDWPSRFSLFSYWCVALPLSYVFGFHLNWGAPGIWAGFGVGLMLAAVVLTKRFLTLSVRHQRM